MTARLNRSPDGPSNRPGSGRGHSQHSPTAPSPRTVPSTRPGASLETKANPCLPDRVQDQSCGTCRRGVHCGAWTGREAGRTLTLVQAEVFAESHFKKARHEPASASAASRGVLVVRRARHVERIDWMYRGSIDGVLQEGTMAQRRGGRTPLRHFTDNLLEGRPCRLSISRDSGSGG